MQSLCEYLAANEELEPAHSVLCNLLRTGADFEQALRTNPLHLAAGSIKHLCTQPDADGVLPKKKTSTPAEHTPVRRQRRRYPLGVCHAFQQSWGTAPDPIAGSSTNVQNAAPINTASAPAPHQLPTDLLFGQPTNKPSAAPRVTDISVKLS